MNEERFWEIIEESRRRAGNRRSGYMDRQKRALAKILARCTPQDIDDFAAIYSRQVDRACKWSLWGAAVILAGSCGDDGFDYFRAWLISLGRSPFERALSDPDSLADISNAVEAVFFEDFTHAIMDAHEEVTGGPLSFPPSKRIRPAGRKWSSTDDLRRQFPKLTAASPAQQ